MKRGFKHSISTQFACIFIGVMSGIVILCILLNNVFLPSVYLNKKEDNIYYIYEQLLDQTEADILSSDFSDSMNEYCLVHNISMAVMNNSSELLYASMNGEQDVIFLLFEYIISQEEREMRDDTPEGQNYIFKEVELRGKDYLQLMGRLDSGLCFMIRTPIESIKESAVFANRFFALIGLVGGLIGAVIIWFVSKRLTRPIKQLNQISNQMVDLQFEARYTGKSKNEIGVLGENMNILSESLEETIRELKNANMELQRDLERREKEEEFRRDFVSGVSHELKTPIALIQGYAEGLKDGITDDPESMEYYCDVIMDEASKMNDLVKNLLTLNHVEMGSDAVNVERFDICGLIEGYLQSTSFLAEQENVLIKKVNMDSPLYVWGDSFLTETVFSNYFSNAVHYCKSIENQEKYVSISLEDNNDTIRVSVHNSGEYIPAESLERVWEKFYKVDKARTREYGGSGVGLSIVKAIQERMKQQYGVVNEADGVTFWFDMSK